MKAEGSYTVEAALVVPLVLVCILFIINQGIELYTEVTADTVYSSWWQEFNPALDFRRKELLKNGMEEENGNNISKTSA